MYRVVGIVRGEQAEETDLDKDVHLLVIKSEICYK